MTHTSYSSISQHRRCPQQWVYDRVQKLETIPKIGDSVHRDLGSWWHELRALSTIAAHGSTLKYTPEHVGTPAMSLPSTAPVEELFEHLATWWAGQPEEYTEAWLGAFDEEPVSRLRHMNEVWYERWAEEMKTEVPIAVELPWSRELGNDITLHGFIDLIYEDTKRNLVVIRDYKTGKTIDWSDRVDDLLESQMQIYAWGASQIVQEWGYRVNALSYDRARAAAPKYPKLNKSGTLSKSVTMYDLKRYTEWVAEGQHYEGLKKDGSGAGTYELDQRMVEHLSSTTQRAIWFNRTIMPLNTNVVNGHLVAAAQTGTAIGATRVFYEEHGFAERNFGDSCEFCSFKALCAAELYGGPGVDSEDLESYGLRKKEKNA